MKNFDIFIDKRKRFSKLDRIFNHYFKNKIADQLRDRLFIFSKKREQWLKDTIDRNILIAEAITRCAKKNHFLDTTKDLYRLKHLINKLGSRIRVLYLVRDGRGVINSLMKRENLTDNEAMHAWLWSNEMIERIIHNYCAEGQYYKFKYEDLCKDTEKETRKIFQFLDVNTELDNFNFHRKDFHIIGNFMRKSFDGDIRFDEKWRRELSKEQIDKFNKLAGPKNSNHGYRN